MNTRSKKTEKIFKFIAGLVVIAFIAIASFDLGVYYNVNSNVIENNKDSKVTPEAYNDLNNISQKESEIDDNAFECKVNDTDKCMTKHLDYMENTVFGRISVLLENKDLWISYKNKYKGYEIKVPKELVIDKIKREYQNPIEDTVFSFEENKNSDFQGDFFVKDNYRPVGMEFVEWIELKTDVAGKVATMTIYAPVAYDSYGMLPKYFTQVKIKHPYSKKDLVFIYEGNLYGLNVFTEMLKTLKFIPPENK